MALTRVSSRVIATNVLASVYVSRGVTLVIINTFYNATIVNLVVTRLTETPVAADDVVALKQFRTSMGSSDTFVNILAVNLIIIKDIPFEASALVAPRGIDTCLFTFRW